MASDGSRSTTLAARVQRLIDGLPTVKLDAICPPNSLLVDRPRSPESSYAMCRGLRGGMR